MKTGKRVATPDEIVEQAATLLRQREIDRLRHVVNATGIVLHTGLGRAVLPDRAAAAVAALNRCCNLQIDLETGRRGKRNAMAEALLCTLTGAEAAMVVNNNAAATFLILAALCNGREVIVSRGQLIEIGGSYRLPDCIHQSGARLVEVGTTNKTHLRDYQAALTAETGAILRVNPSNYRIVGFAEQVDLPDLVALGEGREFLVIDDLGCGALVDLSAYGLPREPTVQESIGAGADLACFSGDKLIGGPQAGIIVGRADCVARIRRHPLTRMLRVDKATDWALEETLRLFLEPETLLETHPTLRMIALPAEAIRARGDRLKRRLRRRNVNLDMRVIPGESATGGGSFPAVGLPTWIVAVRRNGLSADELLRRLRQHEPPVIARVERDDVMLDLRTVFERDEESIIMDALAAAAHP